MPRRYIYVLAAGIAAFIAVGIAGFYGGELMNAPMGESVEHEDPRDGG